MCVCLSHCSAIEIVHMTHEYILYPFPEKERAGGLFDDNNGLVKKMKFEWAKE